MLVVTEREAWMGQRRSTRSRGSRWASAISRARAVFVARTLLGDSIRAAFRHLLTAVNAVVKATWRAGRYELELVAAFRRIAQPREWFDAWVAEETA